MSNTDFGTFTDPRDGRAYKTVKINGLVWLAENLSYPAKGSVCYGNDPASYEKYGQLYNWEMVQRAVPPGWCLPTDEEWTALINFAGSNAGTKLMSKEHGGTDELGFSVLLGGGRDRDGDFSDIGDYGYWWTATESTADYAYNRIMHRGDAKAHRHSYDKRHSLSVHLIQD